MRLLLIEDNKRVADSVARNVKAEAFAVDMHLPAGDHSVMWDGRSDADEASASGIYFYMLSTANYTDAKKMMLLK